MRKCKMCYLIEVEKEARRFKESKSRQFTSVLKVKLVSETWDKMNRLRGTLTHSSCSINFCPQCGREINKSEIVHHW